MISENKVFKKIFRPICEAGVCRIIKTKGLNRFYREHDINVVKKAKFQDGRVTY